MTGVQTCALPISVMTRLRQPERLVLDTLVDAGVARSRSEALVWAVRLVGQHADEWLRQPRDAMAAAAEGRARGPQPSFQALGGGARSRPASLGTLKSGLPPPPPP